MFARLSRPGRVVALVTLVGLVALGACGGDDDTTVADDTSGAAGDTAATSATSPVTGAGLDAYIGLTVEAAGAKADEEGRPWRIVEEDGQPLVVTQDFVPERLNFTVDDGVVTGVTTG